MLYFFPLPPTASFHSFLILVFLLLIPHSFSASYSLSIMSSVLFFSLYPFFLFGPLLLFLFPHSFSLPSFPFCFFFYFLFCLFEKGALKSCIFQGRIQCTVHVQCVQYRNGVEISNCPMSNDDREEFLGILLVGMQVIETSMACILCSQEFFLLRKHSTTKLFKRLNPDLCA